VLAFTLLLLAATAVAFGRIESLKLETNPVSGPLISNEFSPVCNCATKRADISFKLVHTGSLTLAITTPDNEVVRTLVDGKRFRAGRHHFTWNGRDDAGKIVADGAYRIRVLLGGQHRKIVLPKETVVDTKAPVLTLESAKPTTISPDGDHRADQMALRYRVDEHAHVRVLVDGKVAVVGHGAPLSGTLNWAGTLRKHRLPTGTYRVSLVATDLAGNKSTPTKAVPVTIRFVEFRKNRVHAKAHTKFGVTIESDARQVHWQYLGQRGVSKPGLLVLKSGGAGSHVLTAAANHHVARAVVVVTPR
jgi:flagellar hook capping protein FlgD